MLPGCYTENNPYKKAVCGHSGIPGKEVFFEKFQKLFSNDYTAYIPYGG